MNMQLGSKSDCEFHDDYKPCPANIQFHNIEMPEGQLERIGNKTGTRGVWKIQNAGRTRKWKLEGAIWKLVAYVLKTVALA